MNFLCHAIPYLDQPLLAASTGVPDWMSVVDRRVRVRGKLAARFVEDPDWQLRQVSAGILQHIEDDRWFHNTEAFVDTNLRLAVQLRDRLPGDIGFRPMFVGHILIEMFLDSYWIHEDRGIAQRYYDTVSSIDPEIIRRCVATITGKPVDGLPEVIMRFCDLQFLYDYCDHAKLLGRINQVMRRVGLSELPLSLVQWLREADKLVESRRELLLTPPDGANPFGLPFPS